MNQPQLFCSQGSDDKFLTDEDILISIHSFLDAIGPRDNVLIIPPDYTRLHSQAGKITRFICEYYNFIAKENANVSNNNTEKTSLFHPDIEILPALGTHAPMTLTQIYNMFGSELAAKEPHPFIAHDWRKDVETIGHVPSEMVRYADSSTLFYTRLTHS